jgi:DNA primase
MSREDVLSIAQRFLNRVKRQGNDNIMATCPFHTLGERITTTLTMSLTRGVYFCFSCKERGNLFTFLQKMGVSRTALDSQFKYVLEDCVSYEKAAEDEERAHNPLRPNVVELDPLPEALLGLFDYCPLDLLAAGFTEDTLREFDVGFDSQHMRFTYPLRDLWGRLMGISGRDVDPPPWKTNRYKVYDYEYEAFNLPKRLPLNKSSVLWNGHRVYPAVFFSRDEYVVVVEGFKAAMWVKQAGFPNVVALLGSYASWEQRWMLERMGAPVYLMLDNNKAGWDGVQQMAPLLAQSLPVKICEYNTEQPDQLGREEVDESLCNAQDYFLWSLRKGK